MEVLERLTPYVELVHLLLNTNFTYLTRKLAPSDSLDRARIPSAVAKSYDEVLFGGVLFDCVPGIPCEIKTPFGICFTALALWKGDGFVLIGPYLPERADGAQLEEILASQGVPLGLKEQYGVYYRDLPTLSRGKVRAALGVLAAGVYGESLASSAFSSRDISPEDPSPCPVFEEDSMQVRADAIARRYEGERRLMEAVARGDMRAADMVEETTLRLERVPNKLRNREHIRHIALLVYTLWGIPSIYYGSEFGIEGKKEWGSDWPLRPCLELADYTDAEKMNPVTSIYAALGRLKAECPELSWGEFKELTLTTQSYAYARVLDGKAVVAVYNNGDSPVSMEFQLPVEASGVEDLLADCVGSQPILTQVEWGKLKVQLPSNYATLLRLVG